MTTPGESLRHFADLTDLHPEWMIFACLVSRDGLAYNVFAERGQSSPLDTARALATMIVVDEEQARMAEDDEA